MNREAIYADMAGGKNLDYETYLNTSDLLACQKPFDKFCNKDELQFQIVHQVEELWMKLIALPGPCWEDRNRRPSAPVMLSDLIRL